MPTLVLPPRMTPDTIAVADAAERAGWQVERLPSWRVPPGLADRDPVLYGEPLFADVVAGPLQLALLQPPADWLPALPPAYLRRQVAASTLGAARRHPGRAFIKPAEEKCFTARVYDSGAELPTTQGLPEDTPVLISDTVDWQVEYRFFVLDRRLLTGSPYWRSGALAVGEDGTWRAPDQERAEAEQFAIRFVSDTGVALPPAVVVDVGILAGSGWAVVEANAAWGSGIYGCDPARVLTALRASCLPRTSITPDAQPWLRPLAECEYR